jgi:uncharacterized membrane protein YphA (DoxX/SURF4 family)
MNSKTKNIVGWVLAALVAFIFISSGAMKLTSGADNPEMIKGLGSAANVTMLGALELLIAALFLYPRTGIVGSLLAIAYMGGAIAVHLTTGKPILPLIGIQIFIWLVSLFRFPELGQRLFGKA